MIEYGDFFTKGFCVIPNSGLVQYFGNINSYEIKHASSIGDDPNEENISKELNKILIDVRKKIIEEHLTKIFKNFIPINYSIWSGVDSGTLEWHTDNSDCAFLLYFDDMDEVTGGAFFVKDSEKENKIYPKKDTLIWLNQNKKFLHKAEKSNKQRRLAFFDFNLNDKN